MNHVNTILREFLRTVSLLLATKSFIVTDKDSALTNGRYRKKMSMQYLNVINRCQYVNYITFPFEYNMDNSKKLKDRQSETKCKNERLDL